MYGARQGLNRAISAETVVAHHIKFEQIFLCVKSFVAIVKNSRGYNADFTRLSGHKFGG